MSVEEAAIYFRVGVSKLRRIISEEAKLTSFSGMETERRSNARNLRSILTDATKFRIHC